jgi:hypothetical protein
MLVLVLVLSEFERKKGKERKKGGSSR